MPPPSRPRGPPEPPASSPGSAPVRGIWAPQGVEVEFVGQPLFGRRRAFRIRCDGRAVPGSVNDTSTNRARSWGVVNQPGADPMRHPLPVAVATKIADVKEPTALPAGDWELRCGAVKWTDNDDYDATDASAAQGFVNLMLVPVKPV